MTAAVPPACFCLVKIFPRLGDLLYIWIQQRARIDSVGTGMDRLPAGHVHQNDSQAGRWTGKARKILGVCLAQQLSTNSRKGCAEQQHVWVVCLAVAAGTTTAAASWERTPVKLGDAAYTSRYPGLSVIETTLLLVLHSFLGLARAVHLELLRASLKKDLSF